MNEIPKVAEDEQHPDEEEITEDEVTETIEATPEKTDEEHEETM